MIKALHAPILDRELSCKASALKESRRLKKPPNPPHKHLLLGFAYDEYGSKMVISEGVKQGTAYRYYTSTQNHRLTRNGTKALRAGATDLEEVVQAAVCAFFRNRAQVSAAIHALGHRDGDTERLIDQGSRAARWIETFDRHRLRRVWDALIERIDLSRERVLIILRCGQIRAFLAWPGTGAFQLKPDSDARYHHIYTLETQVFAVRTERQFKLPLSLAGERRAPKRGLVELLSFARKVQQIVYEERQSVEAIARRFSPRPTFISRALRLNYLAPDIIAAIVDGLHPQTSPASSC